ncbi:RNA-binding protein NOB1, partial [Tremellales sp. Uapishka_1]
MAISYSSIAQPTADTPSVISIASPKADAKPLAAESDAAGPSTQTPGPSRQDDRHTPVMHLILDAGPLLSLVPLRHLATSFHTTPMVLAELRDPRAREHWERLGLSGVDVVVEQPTAHAMAKVIAFAKKTGDIAVLSQTDLSVIGLTYQYEAAVNGEDGIRTQVGQKIAPKSALPLDERIPRPGSENAKTAEKSSEESEGEEEEPSVEDMTQSIEQVMLGSTVQGEQETHASTETSPQPSPTDSSEAAVPESSAASSSRILFAETPMPDDVESDGEGDWITPSNVATHRSLDLGFLPAEGSAKAPETRLAAACMTGDFAVQNVLLGMGLGLVGEGGKKIDKVRSWVLRCHACFKICKDADKRFCPSCGNPSLLRTTVSVSSKTGEQVIHLKKNFQYHLRGSKYTIPDAKPGRAKGQQKGGSGLVLREDQAEWQDATRLETGRKAKEEKRAMKGDALKGWNDPDWLPEIITVGMSGKGRSGGQGMPTIGHGRKNPNQARRKR